MHEPHPATAIRRRAALELCGLAPAVLQPVTLTIDAGECVSLTGPSGTGKTLLLRAIADLDPTDGDARVDGQGRDSMPAPEWRRRVTYLAAEPGWWAARVADHFDDLEAAAPLTRRLALPDDILARPIDGLSTGERQRLALVRALVLTPSVLLLDEPTAALDGEARRAAEEILGERIAAGAAALWVTHDPDQARRVASRHLRIRQQVVEEVE